MQGAGRANAVHRCLLCNGSARVFYRQREKITVEAQLAVTTELMHVLVFLRLFVNVHEGVRRERHHCRPFSAAIRGRGWH